MSAHLTDAERETLVNYFLRGTDGDVLVDKVERILADRLEQARAEAQDAITGMLHPEFGTEWREPDGIIWKAVQVKLFD